MRGQNENRKNTEPPPPNNIKRNITTTRDEHIDHDPTDKVERDHMDPTTAARIAEAIRLTRPLVPGILSLIERVLGNDLTAEEPLNAAVSAAYEKACEVVASVRLDGSFGPLAIANDLLVDGDAVREQGSPATSPADVGCSYRGVESILRHRLDETPAEPLARTEPVDHDNVRGPMRGGAGRRRQPERQRAVWRRS